MFPNLKLEIFRRGSHQNQLAKAVGIDETVLSKIIRGHRAPTATQRKILATYLGANEVWLFEHLEAEAPRPVLDDVRPAAEAKAGDNGRL